MKYAPAALVAALLVATGLSFLYVESLKLEPSPIRGTRVTKVFSPVCRCDATKARISFRVGKPDAVTVSIVDAAGRDVRDLASNRTVTTRPVAFLWNGRDNAGAVVRDGVYRPRVRLDLLEKTFVLPNPIQVDTTRRVRPIGQLRFWCGRATTRTTSSLLGIGSSCPSEMPTVFFSAVTGSRQP